MSGTRLDVAAIRSEYLLEEHFGVAPPAWPVIDLPFSVMADFLMLGYTLPMAVFFSK